MSRTVWFVAGAGAGVYAMTRVRRLGEALTPDGLADRLAGLGVGLRLFRDEVATGMTEKENEVRTRMGRALHGTSTPALSVGAGAGTPRTTDDTDREDD